MCLIFVTFVYFYTWANRQKAGNYLLDIHTLVHFRVAGTYYCPIRLTTVLRSFFN